MASIVKRKNSYAVVYNYVNSEGVTKQKWETVGTHKEALKRKAEIESQLYSKTFITPNAKKVRDLLEDFVKLYGSKKWGVSMFESQLALITNYINPIIGDVPVQDVSPLVVDRFITELQKTPSFSSKTHKAKTLYITDKTIEKIFKLLRCAFKQAVRWQVIASNPFETAIIPKTEYAKRAIWDIDSLRKAFDTCDNSYNGQLLFVAMNLAFACSCRLGEILGLHWSDVNIRDEDIVSDNSSIFIRCELFRASLRSIEYIGEKDIYQVFPQVLANSKSRLVLKKPKTDSSVRKIWLPKTVAYILRDWKKVQDSYREILGSEYFEYDLVCSLQNGRPCETKIIEKEFKKIKEEAKLSNVVFHSLRHLSATYKLKLNHGDLKATQGDTGHAQTAILTEIYSHIIDEDRKINAVRFQDAFYERSKIDLHKSGPPEDQAVEQPALDDIIKQLRDNPQLIDAIAQLIVQSNKHVSN